MNQFFPIASVKNKEVAICVADYIQSRWHNSTWSVKDNNDGNCVIGYIASKKMTNELYDVISDVITIFVAAKTGNWTNYGESKDVILYA